MVLVTGAAKRIGKSIALRLASEGAHVLIHYNSSERSKQAAPRCFAPISRASLKFARCSGRSKTRSAVWTGS
jgi:NAD(P)-dependent dehydrogenase (short-subunit alcohol dehydrogenase family)